MTTVQSIIGDLLLQHNCVIVPNFGGFVAKRVSAKVDFETGIMKPPSKSLLFNRQLLNNDGLLVNEFAQKNQLDFSSAEKHVSDLVAEWNVILSQGSRIELERIGILFLDEEKNLCFEQDRFFNLLLESFGMGSVHFLTEEDVVLADQTELNKEHDVKHVEPIEEKEPVKVISISKGKTAGENEVDEEIKPQKTRKKTWRYVAAACILPIAFYSIWIPMKTDVLESGMLSINDFNPFYKKSEAKYKPSSTGIQQQEFETSTLEEELNELPEEVDVYTYQFNDDLAIAVSTNPDVEEETPEVNTDVVEAHSMHFIVGCFGQEQNAVNLVAKLRANGFDAKIIGVVNGLHRVSAGGAFSLEGIQSIKYEATSQGFNGWILK